MKKKTNCMKKIYTFIIVILIIGFLNYDVYKDYSMRKEVSLNGKITVAMYLLRKKSNKFSSLHYFLFYLKNTKHKVIGREVPNDFHKNIGKFYKIKYLEKYSEVIHPLLDQEVTDTSEILKAGFSMDEVLNKRKNDLFPTTTKSE
jgi:hypothetical protein